MIAEVFIDLDSAFSSLSCMEKAKCIRDFYDWLQKSQKEQFIAQIIKDADDDVLIDELESRGYEVDD